MRFSRFILIVLLWLTWLSASGNDTLKLYQPFKYKASYFSDSVLLISNAEFEIPTGSVLTGVLYTYKEIEKYIRNNNTIDPWLSFIRIDNCRFSFLTPLSSTYIPGNYRRPETFTPRNIQIEDLFVVINESNFKIDAGVSEISRGSVKLKNDTLKSFHFSGLEGTIGIESSLLTGDIDVSHSRLNNLSLLTNSIKKDKFKLKVENSKIDDFYFLTNDCLDLQIEFQFDSLLNSFMLTHTNYITEFNISKVDTTRKRSLVISFKNSFINSPITAYLNNNTSTKILFDNVSFGPNVDFENLSADTIVFIKCKGLTKRFSLNTDASKKETILYFQETDIQRFDFNYFDRYRLLSVNNPIQDEFVISAYENLLSKYSFEKKFKDYQNVDIDYKKYIYKKNGIWGKFVNSLDRYWWYYGYRKYYIIYWTCAFLLFFFLVNLVFKNGFLNSYPVLTMHTAGYYEKNVHKIKVFFKSAFNVFVLTSLVFFSLHVNFEKISFKSAKWLFWLLIQYITGLICVFFIANAILKL